MQPWARFRKPWAVQGDVLRQEDEDRVASWRDRLFSVTPHNAGAVGTGSGHCAVIGNNDKAFGTFTASGKVCGKVKIWATERDPKAGEQSHHTTITITCKTATTTAALIPAGSPFPPAGIALLGVMGVSAALVTGYAIRTRRWVFPRRLAANPSA